MKLALWNKAMRDIPEKDWKHFRSLNELIINRFSKDTISQISQIIASKEIESKHEKYLKVYEYVRERDKILDNQLRDFRRSNAKLKILEIYRMGLIKPQEFDQFSDEVKDFVNSCL